MHSLGGHPAQVLLIEDDAVDAKAVVRALRKDGYHRVTRVTNLAAGLDYLNHQTPSVVVTDLSLPDASELQAVERIKELAPEAAVVVYSGNDSRAIALRAAALGATQYLVKSDATDRQVARSVHYALEQQRVATDLERKAGQDRLTGLANREVLLQRLRHSLTQREISVALIFVDLDDFKPVNDTYGHQTGDELLRCIGERLKQCVREHDTVARFGGDEFVVLLESSDSHRQVEAISRRIRSTVSKPYEVAEQSIVVSASVGISVYPDDGETEASLMEAADERMYVAKREGGGRCFFGPLREFSKVDVEEAIRNDCVQLMFQPQVDLETSQVIGVEGYMRYYTGRLERASEFLLRRIDRQSMLTLGAWALDQLQLVSKTLRSDLRLCMNVFESHFYSDTFLEQVEKIHEQSSDLHKFEFEVSEDILMRDPSASRMIVRRLRGLGHHVSLDDFGRGATSLTLLDTFPLDSVKIDHRVIRRVGTDDHYPLIESILATARCFGCRVVAEGIETKAQRDYLLKRGCRLGQGYLFGPMSSQPAEAVDAWQERLNETAENVENR